MVTARITSALVLAMAFYRRNLPHWHSEGASIFLTWRLYGSLPVDARSTARIGCATKPSDSPGRAFRLVDSELDRADKGPLWLKDPRIARCVMEAIHSGEKNWAFTAQSHSSANPAWCPLFARHEWNQRGHRTRGKLHPAQPRTTLLAGRVVRPLGPNFCRIRPHSGLHRTQSGVGPARFQT